MAGANPSHAAKEDQRSVDRKAPTRKLVVEGGSVPVLEGRQKPDPRKLSKWEQKAKTSKKDWK